MLLAGVMPYLINAGMKLITSLNTQETAGG